MLIADDMGLGKTVQALALASYYHTSWPVLVVAPSGMRFGWRAEVLDRLPTVGPQDISVITTGKDAVGNSLFVIISYDLLDAKKDELKKRKFQFVILDESHMVKDDKSVRYKAVEPLARGAAHLVLLSGTPALSRPRELYTQVREGCCAHVTVPGAGAAHRSKLLHEQEGVRQAVLRPQDGLHQQHAAG